MRKPYAGFMTPVSAKDPQDGSLPPKPALPSPEECCQSDCPNCVFTIYERELERWEDQVAEILKRRENPRP